MKINKIRQTFFLITETLVICNLSLEVTTNGIYHRTLCILLKIVSVFDYTSYSANPTIIKSYHSLSDFKTQINDLQIFRHPSPCKKRWIANFQPSKSIETVILTLQAPIECYTSMVAPHLQIFLADRRFIAG